MRILLIGNFAPPYEEESLHNLTLLSLLRQEGHDCSVINISKHPSKEKGFIDIKGYLDFIFRLIRHGLRRDVIHFLTKGYTRPGLMKLLITVVVSRLLLAKPIITLHPEMFSVFGRLRSKMGGQQLLRLSFSLSHKIICGDRHTYEIASTHYEKKEKFIIIPSVIQVPKDLNEDELLFLKSLKDKKRVMVFSNIKHPSLLFDTLNSLLTEHIDFTTTGVVISFSGESPAGFRDMINTRGEIADGLVFIDDSNVRILSLAYANADFLLRMLSCDGRILFEEIGFIVRKLSHSGQTVGFPVSLLLIKEGEAAEICAGVLNSLFMEKAETPSVSTAEDFYREIKDIYFHEL